MSVRYELGDGDGDSHMYLAAFVSSAFLTILAFTTRRERGNYISEASTCWRFVSILPIPLFLTLRSERSFSLEHWSLVLHLVDTDTFFRRILPCGSGTRTVVSFVVALLRERGSTGNQGALSDEHFDSPMRLQHPPRWSCSADLRR